MSSSDRPAPRWQRPSRLAALGFAVAALAVSGCTVRPLYSDAALPAGSKLEGETIKSALASIAIRPATNRVELEVRNHMIFLFNGDGSTPVAPKYTLEQSVSAVSTASAIVQVTKEREPTSAIVTVTSVYRLKDIETGKLVVNGRRAVSASYDIPQQEFAALRAQRDAQNRAARELAELLRIAIAQDLERLPPAS